MLAEAGMHPDDAAPALIASTSPPSDNICRPSVTIRSSDARSRLQHDSRNKSQFRLSACVPGETQLPISMHYVNWTTRSALKSVLWRVLYTSNLAASLEF